MDPQPRLAIVGSIQQAITSLLTTYEPEFLHFGYSMFVAFATILIAWHGIKMMLARVSRTSKDLSDGDRTLLDEAVAIAEHSITGVRTLSYLLHPPFLDEKGLLSALRWYAELGWKQRLGRGLGRSSSTIHKTRLRGCSNATSSTPSPRSRATMT